VDDITCTQCGAGDLQPGFVDDSGRGAYGYTSWIEGVLQRGVFGHAKRGRRTSRQTDAYRCPACGHLELFATYED
jgi:DNA-directed RNA polymerase subunit RPC12/RpoP